MASKWKSIGAFALAIGKATIPGVSGIEEAIKGLKTKPGGDEKLAMVEQLVLHSVATGEFFTDKDLLDDAKVRDAYRGFVSAFVAFQNALADAKAAKHNTHAA
jgi:hypothetical protein